ncbi:Cytidine and deoxycytidylate deaminase zinc-binding region [Oceanospirillum multiglobuliferum]|uniref:nucleoside deaminase n=1 Tax=Oceanospirillum multiglobuliferum TaxID=64969 RepID=UPI00099A5EB5|nr:nucleoside deaminase [Oceanospirillum multiglobuliferum]SKA01760.1 Cytidine and deoxycytidylate deaminase zinc-binding region [Oceanospirillum multiglobuliferum]
MIGANIKPLNEQIDLAPSCEQPDDLWAKRCCQQALLAIEQGCYGVGAVFVNAENELVCESRNQVFVEGDYQSQRHAEMELIDLLENQFSHLNRRNLTLYVSLEPCVMCTGRILLSGIGRVRYLAKDAVGGLLTHRHHLPPAWANLAQQVSVAPARVDLFWSRFAQQCIEVNADQMRQKVVKHWEGMR